MTAITAGLVMVVLGITLLWMQRDFITLGWQSRHWIKARAKVVNSKFNQGIPGCGGLSVFLKQPHWIYIYEFHVSGHTYTNSRYSCAGGLDPSPLNLVVGEHITIYHDPTNPERAVVKPGLRIATIGPGVLLLLAGAYTLAAN